MSAIIYSNEIDIKFLAIKTNIVDIKINIEIDINVKNIAVFLWPNLLKSFFI